MAAAVHDLVNATTPFFQTPAHDHSATASFLRSLTVSHLVGAILVYLVSSSAISVLTPTAAPSSLPIVGVQGNGFIASIKARVQGFTKAKIWLRDGYAKYTKQNRAFVLPDLPGNPSVVILPPSQLSWLLELPETDVSSVEAFSDTMYGAYTFLDADRVVGHTTAYHARVLHRHLTPNLPALLPDLQDEVQANLDAYLGTDTGAWKDINLWDMFIHVIARTSNRLILGPALCRDPAVIKHAVGYAEAVIHNSLLFDLVPAGVLPLVGPLVGRLTSIRHWRAMSKTTIPLIADRARRMADPAWTPPNDYITWHLRTALADGRPDQLDPAHVSQVLMLLNFAAIHTTTLAGHYFLTHLLASAPGCVAAVRDEMRCTWRAHGGRLGKEACAGMVRTDSAIRESMRVAPVGTIMLPRKVVAEGGVENAALGFRAPRGSYLSVAQGLMLVDGEAGAEPERYDAFRYSREREAVGEAVGERDAGEALRVKRLGMVTTGKTHLGFGHGRHACPGRFFVAPELKMMATHMFLNYDIEPLGPQPEEAWIGLKRIPNTGLKLRVRRKAEPDV